MTKKIKSDYKAIGVMAGSSMDGLDVVKVSFTKKQFWTFELLEFNTFEYDTGICQALTSAGGLNRANQDQIDEIFGKWIADKITGMDLIEVDLVAVHGHTLIHDPGKKVSWQLGNGEVISNLTKLTTISDFRSADIQLGGEGAPLVPVGDFELFGKYDGCLNLGGIANISVKNERMAWDVCPCNQVLNFFSSRLGHVYDDEGKIARANAFDTSWYDLVTSYSFFDEDPPKSLPNHYLKGKILNRIDPEIGLRTYTEFVANEIKDHACKWLPVNAKVLATGGGTFNSFLIEMLNQNSKNIQFIIPAHEIIEFKEAIIFGLLGVLKLRNEVNVLASVTGASRNSSSGVLHFPK